MSMAQQAYRTMNAISAVNGNSNVSRGGDIVGGTVVSVSPLSINVEGRLTVTDDFIVLSPFCIRAEFENYTPTEEEQSHTHKFRVGLWRGLQVGDEVTMIVSADRQQYYVSHRIGMVFGDMG